MDVFARCFLLIFAQLYVGGLLAISVPPFHGLERGFYKSTASVYLGSGILAFAGRCALRIWPPAGRTVTATADVELALWLVSLRRVRCTSTACGATISAGAHEPMSSPG